ncbi:hypothetical protein [Mongoliimonas terrestris]|uniref:hypothetical protein n=1 Tax=Mongoliimonas terrestris TaxID=1709001 RepID=UPI0009495913|nr:hypothetical protein [Mongoliimonas terrestris]
MQFTIDQDLGHLITGWTVLDNPAIVPQFQVMLDEDTELVVEANSQREDLRVLGWHTTGQCGLKLDEKLVPGLAGYASLEIREVTSGITIYRRFDGTRQVDSKLFFFDCSAMPQLRLINAIRGRFGHTYANVERFAYDTIVNITFNIQARSIFIHGRPSFPRYSSLLRERQYKTTCLLRDPLEEFAERLLFASLVSRVPKFAPLRRCFSGLEVLFELVQGLPDLDPDAVVARIKALAPRDRATLVNPLTKMLACNPDESAIRSHTATALDNLASFDLVGIRSHLPVFQDLLEQMLDVSALDSITFHEFTETPEVRDALRKHAVVREMVDLDMLVYDYAAKAIDEALTG